MIPANLLSPLPDARMGEVFEDLFARPGVRVERIVSHGQVTPEDAPYVQGWDEWVLVLAGAARIRVDGRGEVVLAPGDHLMIAAGTAHRVIWTDPDRETVWLALHFAG